jgi:hypothetical protein
VGSPRYSSHSSRRKVVVPQRQHAAPPVRVVRQHVRQRHDASVPHVVLGEVECVQAAGVCREDVRKEGTAFDIYPVACSSSSGGSRVLV